MGPGGRNQNYSSAKAKDSKKTLKRLLAFMGEYKKALILIVVLCILATTASSLSPMILGQATNLVFDGVTSGNGIDFEGIKDIIVILIGLYLTSSVLNYFMMLTVSVVSQKTTYKLRDAVDKKLSKLPLKYYDSNAFGDILSRVTNDVDTVSTSIQQSLSQLISSTLTIIMVIVMMFVLSPLMAIVALITAPLSMFVTVKIMKFNKPFFQGQQKSTGELNGYVEEIYSGHNIIKAFNLEEETLDQFSELNDKLYQNSWKANFGSGIVMPAIMFCTNLGYVFVAVVGAYLSINGMATVGTIQSMIQYLRQFAHPISSVANISNILQSGLAAGERIFELLDEEEEIDITENALTITEPKGKVSIEHIKFGYSPENILIKDMNLTVNSGDKIAIVGATGAGKTTLVNLILRFYELNGGTISIDGVDIAKVSRNHLRSHFGMVLQDTWLFKGSIMDNIRYGRLDATDEEVIAAAKGAFAHHFINQLPSGYDFMLQEDAQNISQGQRQLLTIARAILSNPTVLILDEATSSVDTRTEQLIQRAMNNLMDNRTSFVIAHRLSTIRDADQIIVMSAGDIVETGNHNSLLAIDGHYAKLYNSQFADE